MKERTISRTISTTEYAVTGIDMRTGTIAVKKVLITGNEPDVAAIMPSCRTADFAPAVVQEVAKTTAVYTVTEAAFIALAKRQNLNPDSAEPPVTTGS